MNLNEYIKQTESEFKEEFRYWFNDEPIEHSVYTDIQAFIKTSIERGVELARQEAIDVVEGIIKAERYSGAPYALNEVIKKLEEMKYGETIDKQA